MAGHFQQAKSRDTTNLHARTVLLQRVLQAVFDVALVLGGRHVDEVDHHQTTQIAQAQLACHFVSGFQIGVVGGFLDIAALGRARRVDIDRGQGLGLIHHDGAA